MGAQEVSRRTVLTGAGAGALWMAAGSPATGSPAATGDPPDQSGESPGLRYYYPVPRDPGAVRTDVCVYGGTSAGVAAAVRAARAGRSVALVVFGRHLGGLSSAGLGATDTGVIATIGGLSREFYRRLGRHYGLDETFRFEPHAAESTFDAWVAEAGIRVFREHRLESVRVTDGRLRLLRTENGKIFVARMFIDASYEGDLLAAAGVSYTVGRESNSTYGETINGVQFRNLHQFEKPVDPYVVPGDPDSGLLQGISSDPPGTPGEGDHRIQAYNFRLCLTKAADRRPFPRPAGYDPARYEVLLRYIQAGVWDALRLNSPMPGGKTDLNNHGAVSTDNIGMNYDWPDGDYATRERIFQDHVTYQQGLLWFLGNDPRVPQHIRDEVNSWGLTHDEFVETDGWSHELYVREGRRMVADYVLTEHDCRWNRRADDPIALGSYTMDSHNCKRVVVDGLTRNEGDVQVPPAGPYGISYRCIVPRRGECENLLVTCALSASHIAFGSVRMEPVFMAIGHAAAVAAELAIETRTSVQDVDYPALRRRLRADGMVLTWPPGAGPLTIDGPVQLTPGEPATFTVAFTNDEELAVHDVRIELAAPADWAVEPIGPATADVVEPGAAFEVAWEVKAEAPDAAIERSTVVADVTYTVPGEPGPVRYTAEHDAAVLRPVLPPLETTSSTEAYFGQHDGTIAILGNGRDLWTGLDDYGAVYHPGGAVSGTVATVTVVAQETSGSNARAGLVFRNDLGSAGSATGYIVLVAKPENGLLVLWDADGNGYVESVIREEMDPTPYPVHLRLARDGVSFHAAYSLDGGNWNEMGSVDLPSAADVQDVGLLACAHSDNSLGLAVFRDFTVATP